MEKDVALQSKQLADREIHRAAGADVFGAVQLLLDKALQVGFGLAAGFLAPDGDVLDAVEHGDEDHTRQ